VKVFSLLLKSNLKDFDQEAPECGDGIEKKADATAKVSKKHV
jgi:hypothetical protein